RRTSAKTTEDTTRTRRREGLVVIEGKPPPFFRLQDLPRIGSPNSVNAEPAPWSPESRRPCVGHAGRAFGRHSDLTHRSLVPSVADEGHAVGHLARWVERRMLLPRRGKPIALDPVDLREAGAHHQAGMPGGVGGQRLVAE